MLEFKKHQDSLILRYKSDYPNTDWVFDEIKTGGDITIGKVFTVSKSELITANNPDEESYLVEFKIAEINQDYYRFPCDLLVSFKVKTFAFRRTDLSMI